MYWGWKKSVLDPLDVIHKIGILLQGTCPLMEFVNYFADASHLSVIPNFQRL